MIFHFDRNASYFLDPIGKGFISPFYVQNKPEGRFVKKKINPSPADFIGKIAVLKHKGKI